MKIVVPFLTCLTLGLSCSIVQQEYYEVDRATLDTTFILPEYSEVKLVKFNPRLKDKGDSYYNEFIVYYMSDTFRIVNNFNYHSDSPRVMDLFNNKNFSFKDMHGSLTGKKQISTTKLFFRKDCDTIYSQKRLRTFYSDFSFWGD